MTTPVGTAAMSFDREDFFCDTHWQQLRALSLGPYRFVLPLGWEVTAYLIANERGQLQFERREAIVAQLDWRVVTATPDQPRTMHAIDGRAAESEPPQDRASLHIVQRGAWLVGEGDGPAAATGEPSRSSGSPPHAALVTPPHAALVTPPHAALVPPPHAALVTPPHAALVTPPHAALVPPPHAALVPPPHAALLRRMYASLFQPSTRTLIQWTFPSLAPEARIQVHALLDSYAPNPESPRAFELFGVRVLLPSTCAFVRVRAEPCDVSVHWTVGKTAHLVARRIGMDRVILGDRSLTDVAELLLRTEGARVERSEERPWLGLPGVRSTFSRRAERGLDTLVGRPHEGEAQVWHDEHEGRIYALTRWGRGHDRLAPFEGMWGPAAPTPYVREPS